MPNDWDSCVNETTASRMNAAHIDIMLRKLGHYSHIVRFTNEDGLPRRIKCHAKDVDGYLERLRRYGCTDARVEEL